MKSSMMKSLMKSEDGQDLIEYALIAALIALVAITAMNGLSSSISSSFASIGNSL